MLSSIYFRFKSRRLSRFWLYTSVIVLSGLFFLTVSAKTASAEPAPANAIQFQTAKNHNGDLGYSISCNPDGSGSGGYSWEDKILSENSYQANLKNRWCNNNPAPIYGFSISQYDPQNPNGYSGSLSYYFSLNSLDKKIDFTNATDAGTYSSNSISYSYHRVAWTENFVEYKIDASQIMDAFGVNVFGFSEDYRNPNTNVLFTIRSSCANFSECDMQMNITAQATRLSDPATPNDGHGKNQPLVGLDENGQKLKAFENSSNVDVSGGDYKFSMPGQISSTVGTLGGLFTTLMSSNSGSCVLTSYVPWVAPLHSTFGNIVNQNFCPNVDFKGSVLDYARQFSVFVVAFIFAFAIYGIARFLFSEAKEWGTPQSGGK